MAGVVSVERLQVSLPAGTASDTAALTKSQTTANCVPFVTYIAGTDPSTADDWSAMCVDVSFVGATVQVETVNGATRELTCQITVVEFDPNEVDVQQGTFQILAAATSHAPSLSPSVTVADTFMVHSWKTTETGGETSDIAIRGQVGASAVTFDRSTSLGQIDGHWYTAEATGGDFTVQNKVFTLPHADATHNETVTSITEAKTFLIPSYQCPTEVGDNNNHCPRFYLSSDTNLVAQRHNANKDYLCAVAVVTFAGAEVVQRGEWFDNVPAAFDDVTITAVDLDVAMPWIPGPVSQRNARLGGTAAADVPAALTSARLTTTTNVRVEHGLHGGEANNYINWEVVEWELEAGGSPPPRRVLVR